MLTNLYIKNFKSIEMSESINLNEFSILCGSNSSGKSSLIQAILLLCQSFTSKYQDESIILNGHLVRLGAFSDIKKHKSEDNNICLSFSLPLKNKMYYSPSAMKISCELVIGHKGKKSSKEDEYHPLILRSKVIVSAKGEDGVYVDTDIVETKLIDGNSKYDYEVSLSKSSEYDRLNSEYPGFTILGAKKGVLVPTTFHIEYDYLRKASDYIIDELTNRPQGTHRIDIEVPEELLVLPVCFINEVVGLIEHEKKSIYDSIALPEGIFKKNKNFKVHLKDEEKIISSIKNNIVESSFKLTPDDFPIELTSSNEITLKSWAEFIEGLEDKKKKNIFEIIDRNRNKLQEVWYDAMPTQKKQTVYSSMTLYEVEHLLSFYFARSVKYLGPLRNEPQAIYSSLGHFDPNSVGLKGEFTAAVLHKNKNSSISYLSPSLVGDKLTFVRKRGRLNIACQEWLSYLGVVQDFMTADRGKLGYELNVKLQKDEKMQDLTHVGVGVSQVLPIVLMFLLSEEDDILIFEQPELHLHPKVQSRLCDLFLAMAESNIQCIIETHSEYLINRLRLRIAQDENESIKDSVSLYFIEKNGGKSEFTEVSINKYGSVINWPKDFFDQTDREVENILYEAGLKRKRERAPRRGNVSNN
ncbi:TPA: DUF3696 domain-containing protein [Serratia marcescens]